MVKVLHSQRLRPVVDQTASEPKMSHEDTDAAGWAWSAAGRAVFTGSSAAFFMRSFACWRRHPSRRPTSSRAACRPFRLGGMLNADVGVVGPTPAEARGTS